MSYVGKQSKTASYLAMIFAFQLVSIFPFPASSSAQNSNTPSLQITEIGIRDSSNGKMVLDIRRPKSIDSIYGFKEVREVTATEYGSGKSIGYKIEYYRGNKLAFVLNVDEPNGMFSSMLEVFDNEIAFEDGIKPGTNLSKHPTYRWNRKCSQKEGIYECSTSSDKVVYMLDDRNRQFRNLKDAVSKSPVKSILVQYY